MINYFMPFQIVLGSIFSSWFFPAFFGACFVLFAVSFIIKAVFVDV